MSVTQINKPFKFMMESSIVASDKSIIPEIISSPESVTRCKELINQLNGSVDASKAISNAIDFKTLNLLNIKELEALQNTVSQLAEKSSDYEVLLEVLEMKITVKQNALNPPIDIIPKKTLETIQSVRNKN
jgi:uncharacterized protein related to proFAR isomerase